MTAVEVSAVARIVAGLRSFFGPDLDADIDQLLVAQAVFDDPGIGGLLRAGQMIRHADIDCNDYVQTAESEVKK